MRCSFLLNTALFGLAAASGVAEGKATRLADDRLLGTWRSNRELTMRYWRFDLGASQEDRQQQAQMFGKTTWHFTQSQFSFQLDQSRFIKPYRVVAKDAI